MFFHEFPLTGFRFAWDKQQALRVAREFPGPETEVLGKKAKQYGCYLVFGSWRTTKRMVRQRRMEWIA